MTNLTMTPTSVPGSQLFTWLRNTTLRIGVLTGVYLTLIMVFALLAANRAPFLEDFADIRNWFFRLLFAVAALIPMASFLRSPGRLFGAGITGWLILSLAYRLMGFFFENLFARLDKTPFHLFMLGATVYGLVAVASWVASMTLVARTHPIAASRRRPY